jgi:hypothetical protein
MEAMTTQTEPAVFFDVTDNHPQSAKGLQCAE